MNSQTLSDVLSFIRSIYPKEDPVPLHAPRFIGNEKKYLSECIDSTYVSYVGNFVTDFEEHIKNRTGARYAIAMVNGTAALQMALLAAGIGPGDEVITQALTFVATAAGIKHAGAEPAFVDVDRDTLGMSPESLESYLAENTEMRNSCLMDKKSSRKIAAIVPMHTFGHPVRLDEITAIASNWGIPIIEDSAESLGSLYKGRHTGRFGKAAIFSFNGNKPVTTGGGGMVVCDDQTLADRIRHISTTAKRKHPWEFFHDEVGYNLRLPNINAALGCAQMENLDQVIENKRGTALMYTDFFDSIHIPFILEPKGCRSNYWLNAIILADRVERDDFLKVSNNNGVQTRPVWTLIPKLPPYMDCPTSLLPNAEWLEDRVVNIPSSYRPISGNE